jgi:UDPglucose--hexose-1-phosphate uridylyltransferase
MHELRRCPLTRRWTVIAPTRVRRPDMFRLSDEVDPEAFDPFKEGNEHATPGEILAFRRPGSSANGDGWTLRVVPNKFPALKVEGDLSPRGLGLYDCLSGVGAHEVIIECPHSESRTAQLSPEAVRDTLQAYQERLTDLKRDGRLLHAVIFKNTGPLAGASLDHIHSQLIALPVVTGEIETRLATCEAHYRLRGRSLFADMITQELADRVRVVTDTPNFIAFCPYASRFAFETWVVPKAQQSHYENMPRKHLDELAGLLRGTLARIDAALGEPAFNYVLHSAPFQEPPLPSFRWHFEIFPRLSRAAGFEWGTGSAINSVPPEEAARFLRDVELDQPAP